MSSAARSVPRLTSVGSSPIGTQVQAGWDTFKKDVDTGFDKLEKDLDDAVHK